MSNKKNKLSEAEFIEIYNNNTIKDACVIIADKLGYEKPLNRTTVWANAKKLGLKPKNRNMLKPYSYKAIID